MIVLGVILVDVDQTEQGSLPDVDVSTTGGNLPEYDVETGDLDVGSEDVTVTVPTLEIETPEEDQAPKWPTDLEPRLTGIGVEPYGSHFMCHRVL